MAGIVSVKDVVRLTTLSRTSLWRLVRAGQLAPPVALSPGRVAWRESDVEAFLSSRSPRVKP